MLMGSVGQKIVSLTYFTFLARTLGKTQTGEYTAALAMSTLFVVFIDLGLTNVLIRDGAKHQNNLAHLFSEVLSIKILTGLLSYGALLLMCSLLNFEASFILLVSLSGITMLVDSLHLSLYGYLRAHNQLQYEAIGMVASQIITLVIGSVCLILKLPLITLMLSFLIASIANAGYAFFWTKNYGLRITNLTFTKNLKPLLLTAIPFALAVIFGRFYSYVDIIFLKKIAGNAAVGIYSTPSKITFAFQFIPLALIATLYPTLSQLYTTNLYRFREILTQSILYLLAIALPISIGILLLAEPIIILAFSKEYLESVQPLRIMIVSLIFSFLSFPLGAALNASGHEKRQTVITGCALLVNIIANLVLIPRYGALGAAYAALLGNAGLGLAGFFLLPHTVSILPGLFFQKVLKLIGAVSIMAFTILYLFDSIHFLVLIILSGLVYSVSVLCFKVFSFHDIKVLLQNLRPKNV